MAPFALSQPTISKHLKVLEGRRPRFSRGRSAQTRPVRLNAAPLAGAAQWIGDYRRFWEESLDQLDTYVKNLIHGDAPCRQQQAHVSPPPTARSSSPACSTPPRACCSSAYSAPGHIMKWFGPKGWPVTMCEMDFRKGGRFRMAMTGPSGKQNTPFGGEYLEIVPNRKIVS